MPRESEEIIKIVQIKSKDRIIFPKSVRDELKTTNGDHIAFIKDGNPGIRVQKVNLQ